MSEEKVIKLFTDGKVETNDKRQFTRLLGGFKGDNPIMSDKQIADLLNYAKGARSVRQRVNENIKHFEFGTDILDLKSSVPEQDTMKKALKTVGYTEQAINLAKSIYIFSRSGFLLFLKFAEGEKAIELYKDFIEDYFKTKAENETMKDTIEDEIKALIKDKAFYLGESLISSDETERIKYAQKSEDITKRIIELEKTKSEKEVLAKVKNKLDVAEKIGKSKNDFDIGKFAKILGIKHMGRNNMFKWLRDEEILQADNTPYQRYMDYFSVQAIPAANGYTYYKTLLKPTGIGYIIKRLEKDGQIITKTVDEILEELNKAA